MPSSNMYGNFWVSECLTESPCVIIIKMLLKMSQTHVNPLFFLNKYSQVNIEDSSLVLKDLEIPKSHHSEHRYSLPLTAEIESGSSWPNVY